MSMSALLLAVRDRIATQLSLTNQKDIAVRGDGKPYPLAGEQFISVHPGPMQNENIDRGLYERFGVQVTVSRRANFTPNDRVGEEVLVKALTGLEAVCRKVIVAIHQRYEVTTTANTTINTLAGDTRNGFTQPLIYQNTNIQEVGLSWWTDVSKNGEESGWAATVSFGQALRVQNLVTYS